MVEPVMDALVALAFLGAGLFVGRQREERRMGALLAWVATCWWLGAVLFASPLLFWGALLHASAAAPRGELGSARRVVAVVVAYGAAASAGRLPVSASVTVLVFLALGLAATAPGVRRVLLVAVAGILASSGAAHALSPATYDRFILVVVEVSLCAVAGGFVAASRVGVRPQLVDLIVQLGPVGVLDRLGRIDSTDGATREARAAAARLVSANGALSSALADRIVELDSSRARLVDAESHERARLEEQLQQGPVARLDHVRAHLANAVSDLPEAGQRLERSRELVTEAREDLLRIGRGLFPAAVADGSIEAAIDAVAVRSPVPVRVDLQVDRLPVDVAATVYYLCAEAVANAVKHSDASAIWITVSAQSGSILVEICDDGVGGAEPDLGTGLKGMCDRVEVLGGKCTITSRPGRATVVEARIPIDDTVTSAG